MRTDILHSFGFTRSVHRSNHSLQTPDTFIRAPLPGMHRAKGVVHASPALGAAFSFYTAELESAGQLGPTTDQRFLFVIQGSVSVAGPGTAHTLSHNGFAFLPAGSSLTVKAQDDSRLAVIEKPPSSNAALEPLFSEEGGAECHPFLGDPDVEVRSLVLKTPDCNFGVNTMTFVPGASLSLVEMHVMEHGLLMLDGGGIYRLGDSWYSVYAGDFIWMAPYCPQWFGAIGKSRARYLIYKD